MVLSRADILRDHAVIEVLSKRLSKLIDDGAEPQDLSRALAHLVDTVASHLAAEDELIYSMGMRSRNMDTAEIERAEVEFIRLKDNWSTYLRSWTPAEIAADRDGFVAASSEILPRLGDRVRLEANLLGMLGPDTLAR